MKQGNFHTLISIVLLRLCLFILRLKIVIEKEKEPPRNLTLTLYFSSQEETMDVLSKCLPVDTLYITWIIIIKQRSTYYYYYYEMYYLYEIIYFSVSLPFLPLLIYLFCILLRVEFLKFLT